MSVVALKRTVLGWRDVTSKKEPGELDSIVNKETNGTGVVNEEARVEARDARAVFCACVQLLDQHRRHVDDEWIVRDILVEAAVECGEMKTAKEHMAVLRKQFPSSIRLTRLEALIFEATGDWRAAGRIYDELLEQDPTDLAAWRRQIAMLKCNKQMKEAIESLNAYLELAQADNDAWSELGGLYIEICEFEKAMDCYEELLLRSPQNPHLHTRYAEIVLAMVQDPTKKMSEQDTLKYATLARKHFAFAIEQSEDGWNARALYGLTLVCQSGLAPHNALLAFAKSKLEHQYSAHHAPAELSALLTRGKK